MMDDIKLACDASKNKAPPARVQTMAFLTREVAKRSVDLFVNVRAAPLPLRGQCKTWSGP
ncbi:hypothetical protein PsorP6_003002 [Peronosclerospora sorghi]|uniref:Uncharacterized protein n=1 Tax=Peronosclerospora sorghi TaxID=230839 RepID=A0ACC0VN86_9STRA|nr:hypothetical protein PsorP6_003002 [Peronosclerospora sorghi]